MKVDFYFRMYGQPEIKETFDFDDDEMEEVIDETFKEWYFNELDRAGIEGNYEVRK